ncbi:retrovirus-related pol polyprotein from transposon TNT 1-94 [Tanacetum coccineum]
MMQSSPICLLSKAFKTKYWLWHRRLSHLNFSYINELAKQGLVRGLLKLKYQKDHSCSAYALGKSKKHTHKPKSDGSIQENLYFLHMDLCGLIRIESINGKKFILVIVDDYSWISHQTSLARTLQQNAVVERQNCTLVEVARPELQLMTPETISSGLVHNPPSLIPYVPRIKNDWYLLFQPMFDEYFNPLPNVVFPVLAGAAPRPADPIGSPSSTSIDQNAPSTGTSSTIHETHSLLIYEGVEE